ncbi:MAG: lysophospholipid acyltransferase family protein [Pseudomonadota bacterium]
MRTVPIALRRAVQIIFFAVIVRPFLAVFMGLATRHRQNLPRRGPAIIIANHNSHLDTLSIMAQMPLGALWRVRPVAAADHFKKGVLGHIARFILRAILIERDNKLGVKALAPILAALDRNEIIIFFPEGSRGEAEVLARFRHGISHLVAARPDVPVIPIYLHNMGKCMPKGAWFFVPFNCEMIVGCPADLTTLPAAIVPRHLKHLIEGLAAETSLSRWDSEEGHGLGDRGAG